MVVINILSEVGSRIDPQGVARLLAGRAGRGESRECSGADLHRVSGADFVNETADGLAIVLGVEELGLDELGEPKAGEMTTQEADDEQAEQSAGDHHLGEGMSCLDHVPSRADRGCVAHAKRGMVTRQIYPRRQACRINAAFRLVLERRIYAAARNLVVCPSGIRGGWMFELHWLAAR